MAKVITKNWGNPDTTMPALQKALAMDPAEILALVESAGLTGRGGACFPAADKWKLCAAQEGDRYVVVNFSNCDDDNRIPNSILQNDICLAVEGLFIAAHTIGAEKAVIFLRNNQAGAVPTVEAAVQAANTILPDLKVTIHVGETESEKGQSQLVLRAIEHGVPVTSQGHPHAAVSGLYGKPTLYHSVETLCCVPAIVLGTYEESKLVQVLDEDQHINCVLEMPAGATIADAISQAGASLEDIKAVSVGGYLGALFLPDQLEVCLSREALEKQGAAFGDLVIRLIHKRECMVDFVKNCYQKSSVECCGRCVFGRLGTTQIRQILQDIAARRGKAEDLALLQEVAEGMQECCSCHQGQVAANMILSALRLFREEFELHALRRNCPARVCRGFISYYIDPELCDGCEACVRVCPKRAIEGEAAYIHVLDQTACNACGECVGTCPKGAVKLVGTVKPKLPEEPIPVGTWGRGGRPARSASVEREERSEAPRGNRYARRKR